MEQKQSPDVLVLSLSLFFFLVNRGCEQLFQFSLMALLTLISTVMSELCQKNVAVGFVPESLFCGVLRVLRGLGDADIQVVIN